MDAQVLKQAVIKHTKLGIVAPATQSLNHMSMRMGMPVGLAMSMRVGPIRTRLGLLRLGLVGKRPSLRMGMQLCLAVGLRPRIRAAAGLGAAAGSGGGGAGKEAQSEDENAVSDDQESVRKEVSFTRMSEKLAIVSTQLLSLQEEKAPKRVYRYLYKISTYLSKLDPSTQKTSERDPIFKLQLENWTFLLSEHSRLCIRGHICQTESSHPNMANGKMWITTAISNVVEDGIVVTVTGSLYGLVGPVELHILKERIS